MEMLWNTSWTNMKVTVAFVLLLTVWGHVAHPLFCPLCVTTRRAEQQRVCAEDGDVEEPSWTTGQTGYRPWQRWTWAPRWAGLRPGSGNRQHGWWVRQLSFLDTCCHFFCLFVSSPAFIFVLKLNFLLRLHLAVIVIVHPITINNIIFT